MKENAFSLNVKLYIILIKLKKILILLITNFTIQFYINKVYFKKYIKCYNYLMYLLSYNNNFIYNDLFEHDMINTSFIIAYLFNIYKEYFLSIYIFILLLL